MQHTQPGFFISRKTMKGIFVWRWMISQSLNHVPWIQCI